MPRKSIRLPDLLLRLLLEEGREHSLNNGKISAQAPRKKLEKAHLGALKRCTTQTVTMSCARGVDVEGHVGDLPRVDWLPTLRSEASGNIARQCGASFKSVAEQEDSDACLSTLEAC